MAKVGEEASFFWSFFFHSPDQIQGAPQWGKGVGFATASITGVCRGYLISVYISRLLERGQKVPPTMQTLRDSQGAVLLFDIFVVLPLQARAKPPRTHNDHRALTTHRGRLAGKDWWGWNMP